MRGITTAFVLGMALILWAPTAQAFPEWFTTKVLSTGISLNDTLIVQLTDTAEPQAFANKWFQVGTASRKEMLAILLIAISIDKHVSIRADLDESTVPNLTRLFLLNE